MCAVIGMILQSPNEADFAMVRRVFLESMIRGKHATGMSFLPHWSKEIQTIKEPVAADKFVAQHLDNYSLEDMLNEDGNLYLIGHCRYSTSTLEFNQPIYNNDKSIVHNGVITQELPENWKELYGYDCMTQNDSELVLHSADPLVEFAHMSMSVCELTQKQLRVYRNGKRPLYLTSTDRGRIITSTSDIATRARVGGVTMELPMNQYTTFDGDLTMDINVVVNAELDYQKVNYDV